MQQRTSGFNISSTESLKVLGQNLDTIEQMKNASKRKQDLRRIDLSQLDVFDFTSRKLLIGQWIDVKDTIHQWVYLNKSS